VLPVLTSFLLLVLDLFLPHGLEQHPGHVSATTVADGLHGRFQVHGLAQEQLQQTQAVGAAANKGGRS
jgi:hypothetical protein